MAKLTHDQQRARKVSIHPGAKRGRKPKPTQIYPPAPSFIGKINSIANIPNNPLVDTEGVLDEQKRQRSLHWIDLSKRRLDEKKINGISSNPEMVINEKSYFDAALGKVITPVDGGQWEEEIAPPYSVSFTVNIRLPLKKEAVNHPDHYGGADNPYEVIKVIEAFPRILNCGLKFNAAKYLLRAGEKIEEGMTPENAEIQDLEKMIWYANRRVENLKKQMEQNNINNIP